MNSDELKEWVLKRNLDKKIIESFKGLLINYENDDPEEYSEVMKGIDKNKFTFHVHTVSLNLGNWPECSYNTVSVAMKVFFNERYFAEYKILYTLEGEPEDDFVDFL